MTDQTRTLSLLDSPQSRADEMLPEHCVSCLTFPTVLLTFQHNANVSGGLCVDPFLPHGLEQPVLILGRRILSLRIFKFRLTF